MEAILFLVLGLLQVVYLTRANAFSASVRVVV